jgi:hypothetical protein
MLQKKFWRLDSAYVLLLDGHRWKVSCMWPSEISVLTPADDLYCVWFMHPPLCCFWCSEIETSSIDWAQLSTLSVGRRRQSLVSETLF